MTTVDIRDVAREAGVSLGTVSNVLNRPHLVAATTRERVEEVIKRTGFIRNASARQLREGQTRTLGLVVHDVTNPFFTAVASAAADAANDRGYLVYLCNSGGSAGKEADFLRGLVEQQVRGVLLTPLASDSPAMQVVRARRTPMVLVDHPTEQDDQCSVAVDDVHGAELAVRHLIDQGHRDLAFVSGPWSIRQCTDRRAGVRRAMRRAKLGIKEHLREIVVPGLNAGGGAEAGEKLLAEGTLPSAIFCANDLLALGVMRVLLRAGVRVPDDVAIVGYDDIEFAAASTVPLSSIRQPVGRLAHLATELLLDECENPTNHVHQQVLLEPELVVRESSAAPGKV